MSVIALCILSNQNEVSQKEAEKIRRAVKKAFPESRLKVVIDPKFDRQTGFPEVEEENFVMFRTYDVNCSIWAEYDRHVSSVQVPGNIETIGLN